MGERSVESTGEIKEREREQINERILGGNKGEYRG